MNKKTFKTLLIIITCITIVIELIFLSLYFYQFHGNLSTETSDWALSYQLVNGGLVMIISLLNIYVFYRMTSIVEERNENRNIRAQLSSVQSSLFELRKERYDRVSNLCVSILYDLKTGDYNIHSSEELLKEIVLVDASKLFDNDNNESFLHNLGKDLMENLKNYKKNAESHTILPETSNSLSDALKNYLNIMEYYILGQFMRNEALVKYIQANRVSIDSTLISTHDFLMEVAKKINQD